jgi:hypothetical protein
MRPPSIWLHPAYNLHAKLWGPFWNTGVIAGPDQNAKESRRSMLANPACLGDEPGELAFCDPNLEPRDGDRVTIRGKSGRYLSKVFYRVRSRGPAGDVVDVPYVTCNWATFPLANVDVSAIATEVVRVTFPGWAQRAQPQHQRVVDIEQELQARRKVNGAHRLAIDWILRKHSCSESYDSRPSSRSKSESALKTALL